MTESADAWECCVCMEDGTATGQLTLACKHNICLECYTKLRTGSNNNNGTPPCPMCRRVIRTTDTFTAEQFRMMRYHKAEVAQAHRSLEERIESMTRYANANDMVRYLAEDVPPLEVAPAPTVAAVAPAGGGGAWAAHEPAALPADPAARAEHYRQAEIASALATYDPARAAGMAAAMPLLLNRDYHLMMNAANDAARPIGIQLGATGAVLDYVCRSASLEALAHRRRHTRDCIGCRTTFARNQVVLRIVLNPDGSRRRVKLRRCITCAPDLMHRVIDGVVTWAPLDYAIVA